LAFAAVAPEGAAAIPADEQVDQPADQPWPDLVLIDGGEGQLTAARETLEALALPTCRSSPFPRGLTATPGANRFTLPTRRASSCRRATQCCTSSSALRDEAHRFAIGSHRARRKRDIREAGLQEIPGIGPTRKRALLATLRHPQGDRARLALRSRAGARRQCGDSAPRLRLLPRHATVRAKCSARQLFGP